MNEIEAASVFYTLSTIAQVLAAFIALSSVFVFYKVNEDQSEMKLLAYASIESLKSIILSDSSYEDSINRLRKYYENGSINGVISELDLLVKEYLLSSAVEVLPTAMLHRDLIIGLQVNIKRLLRFTKRSIFLGVLDIVICIITLSLIPIIPFLFIIIILFIVIILAVLALLIMLGVIYYALNNYKTGYPV